MIDISLELSSIDDNLIDQLAYDEQNQLLEDSILELNRDIENDLFKSEFVLEDAKYSNKNKYPIFIVLMHSGTSIANLIKMVTKDEFSHACISFNKYLNPLYSFGRKKLELRLEDTGFVANSPDDDFFKKFKAAYGVYVMYVDKETYSAMQNKLNYFLENKDTLKYDIFGLLYNYLKIKRNVDSKYFCSRFVAEILNAGPGLPKSPSLYKPNEFKNLDNIELVNSGEDFKEYDYRKTVYSLKVIQDRYKRGE